MSAQPRRRAEACPTSERGAKCSFMLDLAMIGRRSLQSIDVPDLTISRARAPDGVQRKRQRTRWAASRRDKPGHAGRPKKCWRDAP